jgi:hypothetical protein
MLRQRAEMGIAGRELGKRVANPDNRPPVEGVVRQAVVLHPTPVDEGVL